MSKIEYPCFMEQANSCLIVCFSSEFAGHVIVGNNTRKKGFYSSSWIPATNTDIWRPATLPLYEDGEICLVWQDEEDVPLLRRYDSLNRKWCFGDGDRNGSNWSYHTKFKGELPFELPVIKEIK